MYVPEWRLLYKIPFAFFLQIHLIFSLKSESHTTGEFEKVSKMSAHCVDTQGSESLLFSTTGEFYQRYRTSGHHHSWRGYFQCARYGSYV